MLRVVSGVARGRKLMVPPIRNIRPTLDRVREALFNMIRDEIYEKKVLDLFAGSGALGIEALSRGARHVVFVDSHMACLKTIEENLRRCGFEDRAELFHGIIPDCFPTLVRRYDQRYNVIFMDPPYNKCLESDIFYGLHYFSLVDQHARIVIEHSARREIKNNLPEIFRLEKKRVYGEVALSLLIYEPKRKLK